MNEELYELLTRLMRNAARMGELADIQWVSHCDYSNWSEFGRGGRLAAAISEVFADIRTASEDIDNAACRAKLLVMEAAQ